MKGVWAIAAAAVSILSVSAGAANDCKDIGANAFRPTAVPGRLLVKPRDDEQFRRLLREGLGQLDGEKLDVEEIGDTGYYVIDSETQDTSAMFGAYFRQSGNFKSIQSDTAVYGLTVPLEAEYRDGNMWGLEAIHAEQAWARGTGSSNVVAAVVDSGIERTHDDLRRNTWRVAAPFTLRGTRFVANCRVNDFGFDAIDGDCMPLERNRHGTNVSGIIGADGQNDGKFVVGVNWSVTLLPVVLLDESNIGCASRAASALEFVRLVKERGVAPVRVVNLSWGMVDPADAVKEQLDALARLNVVIVAAAGNQRCGTGAKVLYPAAYKTVPTLISVGATNQAGELSSFSNCDNAVIDIGAPGEHIRTTFPGNRVDFARGGTSLATAFVTGAVALMASQCPQLDALALKRLILDSADMRVNLTPHFIAGRFLNLQAASVACRALH